MSVVAARQSLAPLTTGTYPEYDKAPVYLAIVVPLVSVALLTFSARVLTRTRIQRLFALDDWLALAAALCALVDLIILIGLLRFGFGKPYQSVFEKDLVERKRGLWCLNLVNVIAIALVKLSIGVLVLRKAQLQNYRQIVYGIIAFVAIQTMLWLGTLIFQCTPVEAAWESGTLIARCVSHRNYKSFAIINASLNVATNFIFATLSIPVIWNLHANFQINISFMLVLSLGFVACAASITRLVLTMTSERDYDRVKSDEWLSIWSIIEMTTGLTAVCLPSLKPLLTAILNALTDLTTPRQPSSPTYTPTPTNSTPRHRYYLPAFIFPRPNPAYIRSSTHLIEEGNHPLPKRYHDPGSNLTFDLFETPPRIPRTWKSHTRSASGSSHLTNFSLPFATNQRDSVGSVAGNAYAAGSRGFFDIELEGNVKADRTGYEVSITSGEVPWERDDGKIMPKKECEEEGVGRTDGKDGATMGIVRTTTMEVEISEGKGLELAFVQGCTSCFRCLRQKVWFKMSGF